MQRIKKISIVVPAYKQEKTILKNIKRLLLVCDSLPFDFEIILVVDGFVDKTYKKAKQIKDKRVRVFGYKKNMGKGHAVRFGMKRARGDVVGFMDAGLDIDPTGISMLLNHMIWYDADIIVGSKLHPVSQVEYPLLRKILSWGYRTLTHTLFGFRVRDTQVGIKFFRRKVARDVFPRLVVKQFAFDVEILAVAYSLGYRRIYEAPIKLSFKPGTITSRTLWRTIFLMLWDTAAVFYRLKVLKYYNKSNANKSK